jgi:hypothetical protein
LEQFWGRAASQASWQELQGKAPRGRDAFVFSLREAHFVQGPTKERWEESCEQAAHEQDPKRLILLVEEINRLLKEKEERLEKKLTLDA